MEHLPNVRLVGVLRNDLFYVINCHYDDTLVWSDRMKFIEAAIIRNDVESIVILPHTVINCDDDLLLDTTYKYILGRVDATPKYNKSINMIKLEVSRIV